MAQLVEYLNPQSHVVQLSSPDKKIIRIPANSKVILSEWYQRYCPRYLRVIRIIEGDKPAIIPKDISEVKYTPQAKPRARIQNRAGASHKVNVLRPQPPPSSTPLQDTPPDQVVRASMEVPKAKRIRERRERRNDRLVGRSIKENIDKAYVETCQSNSWSISNNIGIGILSYNRLPSLQRLIASIRKYSNLSRTTVFVSDESTQNDVKEWLKHQTDIVVLSNQPRLGIAGNTNRLLKCLSRFKYGIILNDDVEILQNDWEMFYPNASHHTGYQHFCYRQIGVYGARRDGSTANVGDYKIETITEKPHGAVLFYTNSLFTKVGYFDEQFGLYGMEHVDWSNRVSMSGIQPPGFHDVIGSDRYFKIHNEHSIVEEKSRELGESRDYYNRVKNDKSRIYVEATAQSNVPSVSVVIPLRNLGRQEATEIIISSIRAQLFPNIEIIIVEQDDNSIFKAEQVKPYSYYFAKNRYVSQPFTKSMAFNLGVSKAKYNHVILQDADIICPSDYVAKIDNILKTHDGIHIGSRVLYLNPESSQTVISAYKVDSTYKCERAVGYFEGGSLACHKKTYFRIGGFNEIFEGYGIEDCDFFHRLKNLSNFYNVRTEDFIHLWHGRTQGWDQHHRRNKQINQQINKQYGDDPAAYAASLVQRLRINYPNVLENLGI